MKREDLIKVAVFLVVVGFVAEIFMVTPRVNVNGPGGSNETGGTSEQPAYAVGQAHATLSSYSDYLIVFKQGADISNNASLMNLSSINGVAYLNPQGNGLTLVLKPAANVTRIAKEVRASFPDLNISARASFSLPSEIEFNTSSGALNFTIEQRIPINMHPVLEIGENVTLMLTGLILRGQLTEQPVARIVPEYTLTTLSGRVSELSDDYFVRAAIDWESRNFNRTKLEEEISSRMEVMGSEYRINSSLIIENLSSNESAEIRNLSYVAGVRGSEIVIKDDFVDVEKIRSDIEGIVGNRDIYLPESVIAFAIKTDNISIDFLNGTIKPRSMDVFRKGILRLSDDVTIKGARYSFEINRDVETPFLDWNASINQDVTTIARVTSIGRKIIGVEVVLP